MDNILGENIPTDWTAFYQEWLFNSVQKQIVKEHKCSASVSGVGTWGSFKWHSCSKTAKFLRLVNHYGQVAGHRGFSADDTIWYKWFCGMHDPVSREERSEKKYAEEKRFRDAQFERQRTRENRSSLMTAAVGHLTDAQLTELAGKRELLDSILKGEI